MPSKIFSIILVISALAMQDVLAQKPTQADPEMKEMMKKAVSQMGTADFQAANVTFRQMLASGKVLPTNMSYLFAETLYMIGQYQNSRNFINKYIDLAGKGGDYYQEAVDLRDAIQVKMTEIKECSYCNVFGYRLKDCQVCNGEGSISATCHYCKGLGNTICMTCQGDGVVISRNIFEVAEYQSCQQCNAKGHHPCKVCKGNKVVEKQCPSCLGSKREETTVLCDHKPHAPHQ